MPRESLSQSIDRMFRFVRSVCSNILEHFSNPPTHSNTENSLFQEMTLRLRNSGGTLMDCFLMSKTLAIDCVTITESTKSNHLTVRRCCICHQDDFDGDDEEQENSVGIRWSRLHLARRILVRDSIVSDFNIGVLIEPIDGPQNYRKIMDKKNVASIENNEIVRCDKGISIGTNLIDHEYSHRSSVVAYDFVARNVIGPSTYCNIHIQGRGCHPIVKENLLFGSQIGVLAENFSGGYIKDNFIINEKVLIRGGSQILLRRNLISNSSGIAVEVRRNSICGIKENRMFLESKGCLVSLDGGDVSIVKNELIPHLFSKAIVHVVSDGRVLMEKNTIYSDQHVMNIHHLYENDDVEDDVVASDNFTRRVVFNTTWNQSSEDMNSKLAAFRRVDTLESWLRDTRQDAKKSSSSSKRQLPRGEKIVKYSLAAALVIAGIAYVAVNLLPRRKRITRKPLRASEFRWVA